MPALRWCGRRWLVGSDDFVLSAAAIICPCAALVAFVVATAAGSVRRAAECYAAAPLPTVAVLGALAAAAAAIPLFSALAVASCRGRVFQPSRRCAVGVILYAAAVWWVAAAAATCLLGHTLVAAVGSECFGGHLRLIQTGLLGAVCLFMLLSAAVKFDVFGASPPHDDDAHHSAWRLRCRIASCLLSPFSCGGRNRAVFDDVAASLAVVFHAGDIVASDIAAGLMLLGAHQAEVERQRRRQMRLPAPGPAVCAADASPRPETPGAAPAAPYTAIAVGVVGPAPPPPPAVGGRAADAAPGGLEWTDEARPCHRLRDDDRLAVAELQYWSRFYLAAYGHLLHWFRHLFTGLPRLCAHDPRMCCRAHPGRHVGDGCFCNNTAARMVAGLEDDDVLLSRFDNDVLQPAFYVARDRRRGAFVVAVRGTMSLADCVTDAVTAAEPLAVAGVPGAQAHSGMLAAARDILRVLEIEGVVALFKAEGGAGGAAAVAVDGGDAKPTADADAAAAAAPAAAAPPLRQPEIMIVGHSLGAGCAALLAVLLREGHPALAGRVRCIAYAPPGALMTADLAAHTRPYVTGCFMGKDVVPRLSVQSLISLRQSMFEALAASRLPKSAVQWRWLTGRAGDIRLPRSPALSAEERGALRRVTCATPVSPDVPVEGAHESGGYGAAERRPASVGQHGRGAEDQAARSPPPAEGLTAVELFPPASLIHFARVARRKGCGLGYPLGRRGVAGCGNHEFVYYPLRIDPQELREILATPAMVLDHMPDFLGNVLDATVHAMDSGLLDTLAEPAAPRPAPRLPRASYQMVVAAPDSETPLRMSLSAVQRC